MPDPSTDRPTGGQPTPAELDKVKNQLITQAFVSRQTPFGLASSMGEAAVLALRARLGGHDRETHGPPGHRDAVIALVKKRGPQPAGVDFEAHTIP